MLNCHELESHVRNRTGRCIRNLFIDVHPDRIVLRGQTDSYYYKQLAQHGILEVLPRVQLDNSIEVSRN